MTKEELALEEETAHLYHLMLKKEHLNKSISKLSANIHIAENENPHLEDILKEAQLLKALVEEMNYPGLLMSEKLREAVNSADIFTKDVVTIHMGNTPQEKSSLVKRIEFLEVYLPGLIKKRAQHIASLREDLNILQSQLEQVEAEREEARESFKGQDHDGEVHDEQD